MRRYLLCFLLSLLPALACAKAPPSFYVCAHPDDCFLFMSPNLYNDVTHDAEKVVIVYLTSGDAGLEFNASRPSAYPNVREEASIDATEWMADVGKDPIRASEVRDVMEIHGHSIAKVSYANTVSYFLRLPDGGFEGNGFERYGFESLHKLKTGEISSMTPINDEASYTGWNDFRAVLAGIFTRESEGARSVTLHIAEPDTTSNYRDHSDHTTGADAVMEVLAQQQDQDEGNRCYTLFKHIDYSIEDRPTNLEGEGLQNKAGSFAVLTATQRHSLEHHDWNEGHTSYLTRNYFTTTTLPQGCGVAQ